MYADERCHAAFSRTPGAHACDEQPGNIAMTRLSEQVALVTGASRGVGRGVALGLANAGARVLATGRRIADADLGSNVTTITCDHTDDLAVAEVFRKIEETAGRLDI